MKKILIMLTILLCLFGCSKSKTKDVSKTLYDYVINYNTDNKNNVITYNKIKCSYLNNAKAMSHSFFISNDNKVYMFSLENKLDNDENCRLTNYDYGNDLIGVSNDFILDNKLNICIYNSSLNSFDTTVNLYNIKILDYKFYYSNYDLIYLNNNKIYKIDENNNNKEKQIQSSVLLKNSFSKDEYILNITNAVIKTNKAFYNIINNKIIKNKLLTKYYDQIIAYGGNDDMLIIIDYNYNGYNFKVDTNY